MGSPCTEREHVLPLRVLTVPQVAAFFDVTVGTVWKKIKVEGMPAEPRGGASNAGLLIPVDGLARWCEERGLDFQAQLVREYAASGGRVEGLPRRKTR